MFKKFLVCLLLIFVTIFGFGCANVTYSVKYANGWMTQELAVSIDSSKVDEETYSASVKNVAVVMAAFNLNMETYWLERRSEWESSPNKVLQEYQLLYAVYTGDTELFYENGVVKINKNYASIYAYLFYNYPDVFVYDAENDTLKLDKNFLVDIPLDSTFSQMDEAFITKYIQECSPLNYNGEVPTFKYDIYKKVDGAKTNLYSGDLTQASKIFSVDLTAENKLLASQELHVKPAEIGEPIITKGTTLQDAIKACFTDGNTYEFKDANVKYEYKTPYKRVHSNATKVNKVDNYYVHTWDLTSFNDTIVLSRDYAKTTLWYVIALSVSVVVVAVLFVVATVLNKRKKAKVIQEDNKKDDNKKDDNKKDDNKKDDNKKDNDKKGGGKKDSSEKPAPKNKNWIDRIYD